MKALRCLPIISAGHVLTIIAMTALPAAAEEPAATTLAVTASTNPPAVVSAPIASPKWLDDKGLLSTDQTVAILGITPTAEQKARIEHAISERNAAIAAANATFQASLQATLSASDADLAAKAQAVREAQKLENMRRYQPSRYQALKRKNK